jgi:hypothetical protein
MKLMKAFNDNSVEAPQLEEIAECPLCGFSDSDFLFWNFDRWCRLPGKFGLGSARIAN